MKINPVNSFYFNKVSLSGMMDNKAATPFTFETPKCDNCLSQEYAQEYEKNILNALNARKDELYDFLDSDKDENGKTISEKLLSMFDIENAKLKEGIFLHKTSLDNVENLQKYGFDSSRITNTNYGPGFYAGSNEGSLLIYSGVKMQIEYKGNTANGKNLSEYNTIKAKAAGRLMEYLNVQPDFTNPFLMKQFETFERFINEYSRKTIVENGIDGAWAAGNEGYFVIFNPDAIKGIKRA